MRPERVDGAIYLSTVITVHNVTTFYLRRMRANAVYRNGTHEQYNIIIIYILVICTERVRQTVSTVYYYIVILYTTDSPHRLPGNRFVYFPHAVDPTLV